MGGRGGPPRRTAALVPVPVLVAVLAAAGAAEGRATSESQLPGASAVGTGPPPSPSGTAFEETRLHVFTLDYPHVQIPFEITLWILLASLAKIGERGRRVKRHPPPHHHHHHDHPPPVVPLVVPGAGVSGGRPEADGRRRGGMAGRDLGGWRWGVVSWERCGGASGLPAARKPRARRRRRRRKVKPGVHPLHHCLFLHRPWSTICFFLK